MPDDPRPRAVPAPPPARASEPVPGESSSGQDAPDLVDLVDLVDRVRQRLEAQHDQDPDDQVTGYQELEASLRETLRTAGEDS